MKPKRFLMAMLSFVSAIALCCSPSLYIPSEHHATSEVTLAELHAGRRLYVDKCSSCHNLYLPTEYSAVRWDSMLTAMREKAKASHDEIAAIKKYIVAGQASR